MKLKTSEIRYAIEPAQFSISGPRLAITGVLMVLDTNAEHVCAHALCVF